MLSNHVKQFYRDGYTVFDQDADLLAWVRHALPAARRTMQDESYSHWWRYDNSWFVGANSLPNDETGRLAGGPPLAGSPINFVDTEIAPGRFDWDMAQISVCMPGYPRPSDEEPASAHRYRMIRDAAHIDGLRRVAPDRRRFLDEYHGFILGIPMAEFNQDASPFVVWQGSHQIAQSAFQQEFSDLSPDNWGERDVTDVCHIVRTQIFTECARIELHCRPGACFLVHRFALHGMAPWGQNAVATDDGRMICYFRPEISDRKRWLLAR